MCEATLYKSMSYNQFVQFYRADYIIVNSSGGKDSQTALAETVRLCDMLGMARDRIIVSHQCLGEMEWKDTKELAKQQADRS